MPAQSAPLAAAYRACAEFARAHDENFPVASRALPAALRRHIVAVYAFARVADDIADEGGDTPAVRAKRLRAWRSRLHEALTRGPVFDSRDDQVIAATAETIRDHRLPLALFDDLLSAFAQDLTVHRYATWTDLFEYCRRSANPVGRIVLRLAGHDDPALDASSDALCTALQLTNFWQDLGRDWRMGRLYVPREVLDACGADIGDLDGGQLSEAWAGALAQCIAVTRRRFDEGWTVCERVGGRIGFELRLTWHGGHRVLEKVEATGLSLAAQRPRLGKADVPPLLWRAWRRRRRMPSGA